MSLLVTNSCTCINSVLANSQTLYIAPRTIVIAMDASLSTQYVTGFGKPSVWDPRAIRAMRVFSSLGRNLSKSRFCHIHVKQPFF
jgi:hypothetical protein